MGSATRMMTQIIINRRGGDADEKGEEEGRRDDWPADPRDVDDEGEADAGGVPLADEGEGVAGGGGGLERADDRERAGLPARVAGAEEAVGPGRDDVPFASAKQALVPRRRNHPRGRPFRRRPAKHVAQLHQRVVLKRVTPPHTHTYN
jgi:hypothetical protein